ncbi:unnamed protein product [Linum trigynum]|uniref:Uncharacterized protein n=1 Tax=Linum trigynum TaxID=586398 RepID=A0AAV2FCT0_9ROSI
MAKLNNKPRSPVPLIRSRQHSSSSTLLPFFSLTSPLPAASDFASEVVALLQWASTLHDLCQSNILIWLVNANHAVATPFRFVGVSCDAAGSVLRLNLTNSGLNASITSFMMISGFCSRWRRAEASNGGQRKTRSGGGKERSGGEAEGGLVLDERESIGASDGRGLAMAQFLGVAKGPP